MASRPFLGSVTWRDICDVKAKIEDVLEDVESHVPVQTTHGVVHRLEDYTLVVSTAADNRSVAAHSDEQDEITIIPHGTIVKVSRFRKGKG